ncbi:MAG: hypothetical protein M3546_05765 [Actinomycetota bacterium]|nr:hypothetical protein [Actinomycetota bacterium]
MTLVGVPRSLEQVEPISKPLEQRLGSEQLRSRRCKLEREGQPVEAGAQIGDRLCGPDVHAHGACALEEKRDSLGLCERWEVELVLTLDAKRLSARRQQAECRRGGGDLGEWAGSSRKKMLDIVDDHVGALLTDARGDRRRLGGRGPEALRDRSQHQSRVTQRCERDEHGASLGILRV